MIMLCVFTIMTALTVLDLREQSKSGQRARWRTRCTLQPHPVLTLRYKTFRNYRRFQESFIIFLEKPCIGWCYEIHICRHFCGIPVLFRQGNVLVHWEILLLFSKHTFIFSIDFYWCIYNIFWINKLSLRRVNQTYYIVLFRERYFNLDSKSFELNVNL